MLRGSGLALACALAGCAGLNPMASDATRNQQLAAEPPPAQDLDVDKRAVQVREAEAFWDRLRVLLQSPTTVSGDAKAFVDAPENGGRYPILFAAQLPASLRIDALTPLGDPAAVLVAHAGQFALYDVRSAMFFRGPSTPRNLARLLPTPLSDSELVALLCGGVPLLAGANPVQLKRDGDDLWLVQSTVPPGTTTLRGEQQEVRVNGDLLGEPKKVRILEVRRMLAGGAKKPELLWSVRLDDHAGSDASGHAWPRPMPRLIHVSVPDQAIEIDLKLKSLTLDKPPAISAFALKPPAGVAVQELP
ncbi:MAG: hypothetical protein JST92_16810 [Deltaproteobacteria bacterium]|nr:hypothetical protein [Deltaproteobacteria bacterium]